MKAPERPMPIPVYWAMSNIYTWHDQRCIVLVRAPTRPGVIRNALIELGDGKRLTVPARALRRLR